MVQMQFLESGSRTVLFTAWNDPPIPHRGDFVTLPVTPSEALGGPWAAYENWKRWKVDEVVWEYPAPSSPTKGASGETYPSDPPVYTVQVCVSPVP